MAIGLDECSVHVADRKELTEAERERGKQSKIALTDELTRAIEQTSREHS